MKTLLTILFTLQIFSHSVQAEVKKDVIFCHTPQFFKSFLITKNKVVFLKKDGDQSRREIASISSMRSRNTSSGFIKELNFEGDKYFINVSNAAKFSEVDDFMSVRSKKGHEMTYSLSCQII
jgi:hypothetical protein